MDLHHRKKKVIVTKELGTVMKQDQKDMQSSLLHCNYKTMQYMEGRVKFSTYFLQKFSRIGEHNSPQN